MHVTIVVALIGAALITTAAIIWSAHRQKVERARIRDYRLQELKNRKVAVLSLEQLVERLTSQPFSNRYIMLIGAQGSGKTTLAKALMSSGKFLCLSMDRLADEERGADINLHRLDDRFRRRLSSALTHGLNIIDDNLNSSADTRKETLDLVRARGYKDIILVHMASPLELCLAQNKKRKPAASEDALRRTWIDFNDTGLPTSQEGPLIRIIPLDRRLKRCEFFGLEP